MVGEQQPSKHQSISYMFLDKITHSGNTRQ